MASRRRIGPWVAGVGTAGVLDGHAATYALAQPDGVARRGLLAATGHAWLHVANEAAVAVSIVAMAAAVLGRLTREREADVSTAALFHRLALVQLVAFIAIEVAERATIGAPVAGALTDGVLPLGLIVQSATALVAAVVLSILLRSADRLLAGLSSLVPPRTPLATIAVAGGVVRRAPARGVPSIRGPPSVVR
jgi:hypothetical protein